MNRADIFAVAGSGDFAGKPRPGLVVQSNIWNELHHSVTVCPISGHLSGDYLYRIPILKDDRNGLRFDSEVEVDKVQSVWLRRLGRKIGVATPEVMAAVDLALKRWLDL